MSIYRKSVCPRNDVYAIETMKEMLVRPALPMSVGIEEHKESTEAYFDKSWPLPDFEQV